VADKLTKSSNGEIKAERLFVGNEQEIVAQLVRGRIELAAISSNASSVLIPEMSLLYMPYLWSSDAERDFVTDNYAVPVMKKLFEAKGILLLEMGDVGWSDVFCKKACLTPADVKGMKVRVTPSSTSKLFWGALDTNGVQMPLSELFPALQSGLVEAGDLPFMFYITTPAAQSAPHFVRTRHQHLAATLLMNKALFHKLKPEQQKMVMDARWDVAQLRKATVDTEQPKIAEFRAKGGFVHELTPAQRAEWAKLVEPHRHKLVAEIGGAAPQLWAAIQKGKQEFAARGGK
jgi:TRAP-type C4-dicarboxylate transport system substrate-binding protein